jgi:hypothetical protein
MTLAQQNGITQFPYIIKDANGNIIYLEDSGGLWYKSEYDVNGKENYFENSFGYWVKKEYSDKREVIYYEDSIGNILDKRIKKPVNHLKVKVTI